MLEIARQIRPSLYDLQFEKPEPLVPRRLCFEVPERLGARGEVVTPLDEAAVRDVAAQIGGAHADGIAAKCFEGAARLASLNPVRGAGIQIDSACTACRSTSLQARYSASEPPIGSGTGLSAINSTRP